MTILGKNWSNDAVMALIIAVVSLLLSSFNSCMRSTQDLEVKVRALEVQFENEKPRLERIENKVDWVIQHMADRDSRKP